MTISLLDVVSILFGLAAVLGLLNHHVFKLPFTIGMTFSAMLASLLVLLLDRIAPGLELAATVRQGISSIDFTYALLNGMLGLLLFAGALHTDIERLRKFATPVGTLAIVGTLIATTLMGYGSYYLFGLFGVHVPLIFCFIFGALIAPTDPVAVLGIMRAAGAPKDLEIQVIGESLFNDGIGVVVFAVLVGVAAASMGVESGAHSAHTLDMMGVLKLVAKEVIGGISLGLVLGYLAFRALRSINEPNLEILISVALVMVINFVAFKLHTSAPLASVVAGLLIGNKGRYFAMNERTRAHLDIVWSFVDEALNAILFLLIGLEILMFNFKGNLWMAAAAAIPLALLARFLSVTIPINLLKALRIKSMRGSTRVLTWGGLKGGISIALAMSLPEFAGREAVLSATYTIVMFSILVQGLTVGKLIKHIIPEELRTESISKDSTHH